MAVVICMVALKNAYATVELRWDVEDYPRLRGLPDLTRQRGHRLFAPGLVHSSQLAQLPPTGLQAAGHPARGGRPA